MNNTDVLNSLTKEQLIELIRIYSRNWLAHDGVWFQSIERKSGMDEAMFHDVEAWRRFTVTEARRIKKFLNLPERAGLSGLARALELRFYGNINEYDLTFQGDNKLVFRNVNCIVQTARQSKGMPFHPCKSVGIVEYSGFAQVIDNRITCRCLSCYPDITDDTCCCSWEFTLTE